MSFASRIAARTGIAALVGSGHPAWDQVMAPSGQDALARTVSGKWFDSMSPKIRPGDAGSGNVAPETMIFKDGYDFRWKDAKAVRTLLAAAIVGAGLLICALPAQAQQLPPSSPEALVRALQTRGVDSAIGFQQNGPIRCKTGTSADDWSYRCTGAMIDSKRGGRIAALEFMVYKHYDFAARDGAIKAAVARMPARWKIDSPVPFDFSGRGLKVAVRASCHQARGQQNSLAYCLTPLSSNVLIFTSVPPLDASSDHIGVSITGGRDSSEDMKRSAELASLGAITVAKFGSSASSPPAREFSDDIFRKH